MTAHICDADHVARYCPPRCVEEDGTPAPCAFELKARDECCLSVSWLEYFGGQSTTNNVECVRRELRQHYELKKNGRLAVLNIGMVKYRIETEHGIALYVKRDPQQDYPSHACISGYSTGDEETTATLSEMVGVNDVYPAVETIS